MGITITARNSLNPGPGSEDADGKGHSAGDEGEWEGAEGQTGHIPTGDISGTDALKYRCVNTGQLSFTS